MLARKARQPHQGLVAVALLAAESIPVPNRPPHQHTAGAPPSPRCAFVRGTIVFVAALAFYGLAALLIHLLYNPDVAAARATAVTLSILPRSQLNPEPKERALFLAA